MAPGKSCISSALSLAASPPESVSEWQVKHIFVVSGPKELIHITGCTTPSYLRSPHCLHCSGLQPSRLTGNAGTTLPSLFLCGQTGRGCQEAGGPVWCVFLPFLPPAAPPPDSPPLPRPQPEWCRWDTFCSTPSCELNREAAKTPIEGQKGREIYIFFLLAGWNWDDSSLLLKHSPQWFDSVFIILPYLEQSCTLHSGGVKFIQSIITSVVIRLFFHLRVEWQCQWREMRVKSSGERSPCLSLLFYFPLRDMPALLGPRKKNFCLAGTLTLLLASWQVRERENAASQGVSSNVARRGTLARWCARRSWLPSSVTWTGFVMDGWKVSGS